MTAKNDGEQPPLGPPPRPRDVFDFHLRWSEFRPWALHVMARSELSETERETLRWLVAMADRIERRDLDRKWP